MTDEEYNQQATEILAGIPEAFRGFASMQAYDRGHSAGYEEVIGILKSIVFDLHKPIAAFDAMREALHEALIDPLDLPHTGFKKCIDRCARCKAEAALKLAEGKS